MGWGSGSANFPYLITPDTAIQSQAIADGSVYQSIFGTSTFGGEILPSGVYIPVFTSISILQPLDLRSSLTCADCDPCR
jgi:hypothetical protein